MINHENFLYLKDSKILLDNCVDNAMVIKEFNSKVKSEIVFKNRLYLNIYDEVWVSDGTVSGTNLLKNKMSYVSFKTTFYNLYVLEYPSADVLKMYTVDTKNKTLKRVLKNVSINTSRFAHFGTPYLYITRWGSLFRLNELTHEVVSINEQPLVYYPSVIAPVGGKLLHFVSEKGEIFASDGSKEGTKIIKSFRNIQRDHYFRVETVYTDRISFLVVDNKNNMSLYETDGTEKGTIFIKKVEGLTAEVR